MKKITLLLFIGIITFSVKAQQFPLQSQYQFNYSVINPAAVGQNDYYSIRTSFRQQWVGLTDNPISTSIMSATKAFGKNGLGITIFNDQTGGALNKSGAALSYSHKVPFSNSDLYFGVSAGTAKINVHDIDDPALLNTSDVLGEATFGVYYTQNNWKVGVSVPGLLNSNMEISNSNDNTINSHIFSMLSYKYDINEEWSLYPSALMKTTKNHNQIDVNLNVKLRNKLWFGTSYRQDFGPTIYVGIDFGRMFSVYSDDISTNEANSYSHGSHEITLGYDFIDENALDAEKEKEAKVFDRDEDGVLDIDDLCPDEAGDVLSNGCPDSDKDGIPNDYDLCPNLFGSEENQGCPKLTQEEEDILSKALGDLRFGFDKDEIDYSSYVALTDLTVLMHKNPDIYLLIEGHASPEGTEEYNMSLSARRAKSVQKFFIDRGLDKSRMIIDFYGENNPKNDNLTEDEKAENRRVEFEIKYHLYDQQSAENILKEYNKLLGQDSEGSVVDMLEEKEVENIQELNEEGESIETENLSDESINIDQETTEISAEESVVNVDDSTDVDAEYGTENFKDHFDSAKKQEEELNFPEREDGDQVVSRFRVTFDSIIFESPQEETIQEEQDVTTDVNDLPNDFYRYNAHHQSLDGRRRGNKFSLGDRIDVFIGDIKELEGKISLYY